MRLINLEVYNTGAPNVDEYGLTVVLQHSEDVSDTVVKEVREKITHELGIVRQVTTTPNSKAYMWHGMIIKLTCTFETLGSATPFITWLCHKCAVPEPQL